MRHGTALTADGGLCCMSLFSSPKIIQTNLMGKFRCGNSKQTLFFNCRGKLPGNFGGSVCQYNVVSLPVCVSFFPLPPPCRLSRLSLFAEKWREAENFSFIRYFLRLQFLPLQPSGISEQGVNEPSAALGRQRLTSRAGNVPSVSEISPVMLVATRFPVW